MSSLRCAGAIPGPSASARAASLKSFLEKMFCVTKIRAPPKAQRTPKRLPENSTLQARMTPRVRGMSERYVAVG